MYKLEDLTKYDYFKDVDIAYALDSLTGVVARGYILGFAQNLVEKNVPFMMGIMDVDNFKLVNDNYGHKFGDECLKEIGTNLIKYVGNDGLVGRFGGDEFIILYFGDTSYDNIHEYIANLYNEGNVIRRRMVFDKALYFVTATTGCASFPKDADNYDDLFLTVDKALYRGKSKGRNCFIIYVEAKHKNIDVHKKDEASLPYIFKNIYRLAGVDKGSDVDDAVKNILDYVTNILQISQAVYLKVNGDIITSTTTPYHHVDEDCVKIITELGGDDEVFAPKQMSEVKHRSPKVQKFIEDRKVLTLAISKVKFHDKTIGHIIFFENKIERVWQEKDVALLMYLDRLFYILYLIKKNK